MLRRALLPLLLVGSLAAAPVAAAQVAAGDEFEPQNEYKVEVWFDAPDIGPLEALVLLLLFAP